ncbi:MAG: aspartate carbamoyltransferase [Candidatus Lokiarchaeota archaeon]|nr:aspartate carbamoyltransferase [Candidatus Lokiarchaeota archaeon]
MPNPFANRDVISTLDFSKADIEYLLDVAGKMADVVRSGSHLLANRILASIFLEPSTRTRLSFDAAMKHLGGQVIGFSDWDKSSLKKGETLSDTLKVVQGYSDILVIRSEWEGAARYAAEILDIPVINAGSGAQEHPTQSFLDLMTIQKERGTLDGLTVGICGDLMYGRTVHSLLPLLVNYNVKLKLISPQQLKIRREDKVLLESKGVQFDEMESLDQVLPSLDVLYMTRIQRERFRSDEEFLKVKGFYVLTSTLLKHARKELLVMHPLPRVNEIDPSVDKMPQAVYFKQPKYGMYLRMALLGLIFDVF